MNKSPFPPIGNDERPPEKTGRAARALQTPVPAFAMPDLHGDRDQNPQRSDLDEGGSAFSLQNLPSRQPVHRKGGGMFVCGLILVGLLVGFGLLGLFWLPEDTMGLYPRQRFLPPSLSFPFGTDHMGRNLFGLVMAGAAATLSIAVVGVSFGMIIGVVLGVIAAQSQPIWGKLTLRGGDFLFAFPTIISVTLFSAAFGPSAIWAIVAIGLFNIPVFLRVSRAAALPIMHQEFMLAARLAGRSRTQRLKDHVLPNILPQILVQFSLQIGIAIVIETGFGYLGLGVQPPQTSWGRLLSDAQTYIFTQPTIWLYPGGAIFIAVLGFQLLGDGLRDMLDRRMV